MYVNSFINLKKFEEDFVKFARLKGIKKYKEHKQNFKANREKYKNWKEYKFSHGCITFNNLFLPKVIKDGMYSYDNTEINYKGTAETIKEFWKQELKEDLKKHYKHESLKYFFAAQKSDKNKSKKHLKDLIIVDYIKAKSYSENHDLIINDSENLIFVSYDDLLKHIQNRISGYTSQKIKAIYNYQGSKALKAYLKAIKEAKKIILKKALNALED